MNLGREPVAILGTIVAVLIAVQQLALNIPSSVHAIIAVVLIVLSTVLSRASVTPVGKPAAPPPT